MNFDPKNRQHLLLLATVVIVGIFLADRIVLTPMIKAWKARSARLVELKRNVNEGEALLQRSNSLQSRCTEMRTNALPVDAPVAESQMLRAFDNWSRQAGVSVSSIRPQWKRANDDYVTLECRADVAGDIGDVTRFLYEIERDPLGVKVDSAALATRDSDGAQITLTLQVSGLQLIPSKQTKR
jgi:hypothetical protein